jgi:hypothetical protein
VGELRTRRCHLRAGFQQCKSFVEMEPLPGPLLSPPPSSSSLKTPIQSYSVQTPSRNGNPTPSPPEGSCSLRRGRGTGCQNGPQAEPTKRQPATAGVVEQGRRVTTARRTTTRAAPGCRPEDAHTVARPPPQPHAVSHLANNDRLLWKTDGLPPANGPSTTASQQRHHIVSTPARGPPRPPTPRPSLRPPQPSQSQG